MTPQISIPAKRGRGPIMHINELMRPSLAQSCPHLIFNLHYRAPWGGAGRGQASPTYRPKASKQHKKLPLKMIATCSIFL
jgi:hypothetical protein